MITNEVYQDFSLGYLGEDTTGRSKALNVVRTSAFPGPVRAPYPAPKKIIWTVQLQYPLPPPTPYNPEVTNIFGPNPPSDPATYPKPNIRVGESVGTDGMPFIFQSKDTAGGFFLPSGGTGANPDISGHVVDYFDGANNYQYIHQVSNALDYRVLNYSTGYAPNTRFNSVAIATVQVELDNLDSGNYPVIIKN